MQFLMNALLKTADCRLEKKMGAIAGDEAENNLESTYE